MRGADAIVQVEQGPDPDQHRRHALQQEQPLPAAQAVQAGAGLHDPARQRPADHAGHRHPAHEQRHHARAPMRRIPIGQVQDDAGEEARLGRAQQEAQQVEAGDAGAEHQRRRDQAPGHHDAGDPDARAHARHQQVGRHLEQEIADEEDPGAGAVHGVAEAQVGQHLQLGEADVDTVQVGHHVAQE